MTILLRVSLAAETSTLLPCRNAASALLLAILLSAAGGQPTEAKSPVRKRADYRREMIDFVSRIARRARRTRKGFGVFPQNGSELGRSASYLAVTTGIGQEDMYYGYERDGKRTPADETKYLERNLRRFRKAGKLVLTVDYPFRRPNRPDFRRSTRRKIDRLYRRSSRRGFVPYATVRELNYLVKNRGHKPRHNRRTVRRWRDVKEWCYQLQPRKRQSRRSFLRKLGKSKYDLVVMDYSFAGDAKTEFTAKELRRLKRRLRGKVLAYLSIGEAEDYRWYWQEWWDSDHDGKPSSRAPNWLVRGNPDWEGNYKVRYWDPDWQDIIFDYLDKILAQGFDGVYLDLVEAYEYFE